MLNILELHQKLKPYDAGNLENIGDVLQYALPWSALLYVALQGDIRSAQLWVYSGLVTIVVTVLGKLLFNMTSLGKRPNGGPFSFPSGHTSSAFMGGFFWLWCAGWLWALLPLLLAMLTGYSRVYAGKHWWRDVLAGIIVALVTVFSVFRY